MKWEKVSLRDYTTKIGSGVTPKGGASVYQDSGVALFRSQNIYNGIFFDKGLAFINEVIAEKMKSVEVLEGDVLLNITGDSVARCCYAPVDFLPGRVNQHVAIVRADKEKLHSKFLMYQLISPFMQNTMLSYAEGAGATRNALTKGIIEDLKINLPPLPTQRKIAFILSAYDDLIENNLKRIKLLEEAIRTHYKLMMSENDGSWETQRIDDAYDFSNGYAFYKEGYSEDGNIVIDLGNISESSNLIMTGKEKFVSELLYDDKKKFHLNKYDVIVAMTDMTSRLGILAKVALIDESNKYILNQRVGRLRSKIDYIDHCFLYASLSNDEFRNDMKTKAKGAVQIYFNTKDILEYEVVIPPKKMVEDFSKIIRPIIDLRFLLNKQNTKLREARDILLPKLMNGQIEV